MLHAALFVQTLLKYSRVNSRVSLAECGEAASMWYLEKLTALQPGHTQSELAEAEMAAAGWAA